MLQPAAGPAAAATGRRAAAARAAASAGPRLTGIAIGLKDLLGARKAMIARRQAVVLSTNS